MKILIVDDSSVFRRAIVKVAKSMSLSFVEASNGAEALVHLRKLGRSLSLVIMDWNMPIMDGYEALGKIRSNKDFDGIPVLMATSDDVEEDVVNAIKAGANGYLVKPFTAEDLTKKIEELLPKLRVSR